MTTELESEVSELCNLSQWVYNEGVKDGLEQGIIGAVELLREAGITNGLSSLFKGMLLAHPLKDR